MRDRLRLIAVTGLVVLAGGVGGVLPSSTYVSWALAGSARPNVAPVEFVERPQASKAGRSASKAYRIDFKRVARRAAIRHGIRKPNLFVRQIAAESGFKPCVGSPAGALGIAQIMPSTADSWKVDPFNPTQALDVAAKRMAVYERQLGSYELALAAYNAGPGAVQKYGGVPPYRETRRYIERIMGDEEIWGLDHAVFTLPSRFTPTFRSRLRSLQRDVRRHGGRVQINSGFRDYQEQSRLWRDAKRKHGGWRGARRWVAPPGCSNHNKGTAADLKGDLKLAHRLAGKHGLAFPMSHEPWHAENA